MWTSRSYAVTAGVLAVLAAACSPKQENKTSDSVAATPAPAAQPNVVTVTASDYKFDAPDSVPGGLTTMRMVNQGPTLHHVQVVHLLEGKTFADLQAAFKSMGPTSPLPSWMHFVGGVQPSAPGMPSEATLALEPGNYAIICLVDIPDHIPHFAKGMARGLIVGAAPAVAAAPPTADVNVTLSEYTFAASPALSAGKHTLKIENTGTQPHEVFLLKLDAGKTADDLMKWGQTYKGPPPGTPAGGTNALAPGSVVYVPVDLTPGDYILVCFLPDAKDGKPHLAHGMIQTVKVA